MKCTSGLIRRNAPLSASPGSVKIWLLLCAAWLVIPGIIGRAEDQAASSSPKPARLASFKERLAVAESVKVKTDLLGIELGSEVESARHQLEKWIVPGHPSKEPADREEDERKTLWELKETDFASIFVKADEKNRITYMIGVLRPGKEVPFASIGEVEKAPIRTDHDIAWDVVRPNQQLIRVVASGNQGKAASITIFEVRRISPH
jgi:hypothetical protein